MLEAAWHLFHSPLNLPLPKSLNKMTIANLHSDLILQIFDYLDGKSMATLSCTCKKFAALGMNVREQTTSRFRVDEAFHQQRLDLGEFYESSWQQLYQRLDAGVTGFKGFALDFSKADMYDIEMVLTASKIKEIRGIVANAIAEEGCDMRNLNRVYLQELEGFIRWRSADEDDNEDDWEEEELPHTRPPSLGAVTLVQGSIIDKSAASRFVKDPLQNNKLVSRHIIFEEYYLAKGRGIAVPNRYYGMLDGCLISGSFDPSGGNESKGVYIMVMEESITLIPRPFLAKQVWIGGVADTFNARSPYSCRLFIESIHDRFIQGSLKVDESKPFTSCRLQKEKQMIHVFNFTASLPVAHEREVEGYEPKVVLTNLTFTPNYMEDNDRGPSTSPLTPLGFPQEIAFHQSSLRRPLIPSFPITLYRLGPILFSLFLSPTPTVLHFFAK